MRTKKILGYVFLIFLIAISAARAGEKSTTFPFGLAAGLQGTPFSTVQSSNPLLLATVQNIVDASINASGGYNFISGVTSRTIYPLGLTVTPLGGNASGAFGVVVECTSGNILASIPIANLISGKPVTYTSVAVTTGTGFTGCAPGDSVLVSSITANLTTATSLVINMPFTIQ